MAYEFKLPDLGEGLTEGEIARILVEEGKVVPVGTVLVVIGGEPDGDQPRAEAAPQAPARPEKARATPLVRRIAREFGIDLDSLEGTGPQGRITEDDVRRAAVAEAPPEGRREPLRGMRRLIAEHMTRAHREVPAVTWVEECDFGRVPLDLLVPTLLKAYSRSVEELAADVSRLAEAARAGSLAPEELRGSTFTVTSAGKVAGLFQTPIVNHPEVAILSVGRIAPRPVVRDGEVTTAPIGYVSVTFDHRVVDGARAAAFGLDVIRRLEAGNPS